MTILPPSINPIEGLKALSEASPSSLDDLFSTPPLELTDDRFKQIIVEFRKMRERWKNAELAGKNRLQKTDIPKALQSAKPKVNEVEI